MKLGTTGIEFARIASNHASAGSQEEATESRATFERRCRTSFLSVDVAGGGRSTALSRDRHRNNRLVNLLLDAVVIMSRRGRR